MTGLSKEMKGSFMIEATYMIPITLLVWMLIIFGLFYYHDKQILSGAAYETAVAGSRMMHEEGVLHKEKAEQYFRQRIQGKLLFFGEQAVHCELVEEDRGILLHATANAKRMKVHAHARAAVTEPEKKIRMFKAGEAIREEVTR